MKQRSKPAHLCTSFSGVRRVAMATRSVKGGTVATSHRFIWRRYFLVAFYYSPYGHPTSVPPFCVPFPPITASRSLSLSCWSAFVLFDVFRSIRRLTNLSLSTFRWLLKKKKRKWKDFFFGNNVTDRLNKGIVREKPSERKSTAMRFVPDWEFDRRWAHCKMQQTPEDGRRRHEICTGFRKWIGPNVAGSFSI